MHKHVLVIDDDPIIISLLTSSLEAKGYGVIAALDGREGLQKLENTRPDLIILDIMLPGMNGYTVYAFLKYTEKYKSIPVIMLTTRQEIRDKIFDKEVKPDGYITKPFEMKSLMDKVEELVG